MFKEENSKYPVGTPVEIGIKGRVIGHDSKLNGGLVIEDENSFVHNIFVYRDNVKVRVLKEYKRGQVWQIKVKTGKQLSPGIWLVRADGKFVSDGSVVYSRAEFEAHANSNENWELVLIHDPK